jgi:hypothetical protein
MILGNVNNGNFTLKDIKNLTVYSAERTHDRELVTLGGMYRFSAGPPKITISRDARKQSKISFRSVDEKWRYITMSSSQHVWPLPKDLSILEEVSFAGLVWIHDTSTDLTKVNPQVLFGWLGGGGSHVPKSCTYPSETSIQSRTTPSLVHFPIDVCVR